MCVLNVCYVVVMFATPHWLVMVGTMFAIQCVVMVCLRKYEDVIPFALGWKWTSLILLAFAYLCMRNTPFERAPEEYTRSVAYDAVVTGSLSALYAWNPFCRAWWYKYRAPTA